MSKTLYVSDLDGTLLNSQSEISSETAEIINSLVDKGLNFTFATARSLSSAEPVTQGLTKSLPVIVYNGTFIIIPETGERILQRGFSDEEQQEIREILTANGVYPIAYAIIDGAERASWFAGKETEEVRIHVEHRTSDERTAGRMRKCESIDELYFGDGFYYTCIDKDRAALEKVAEEIEKLPCCNCTFQRYENERGFWLEIMPKRATKADAIAQLKEKLGCDRVVAFGDSLNDISMFLAADECYAVENALDEVKQIATGVIGRNDENAVANWLKENAFL